MAFKKSRVLGSGTILILSISFVLMSCGSGGEVYKDSQDRFTIKLSKGWTMQGEQGGTIFMFRKPDPPAELYLTFFLPPPNSKEVDAINYYVDAIKRIYQNVSPSGPVKTGAGTAEAIYEGTYQNNPLKIWFRVIREKDFSYLYQAITYAQSFDKFKDEIDATMKSLKVTNPKPMIEAYERGMQMARQYQGQMAGPGARGQPGYGGGSQPGYGGGPQAGYGGAPQPGYGGPPQGGGMQPGYGGPPHTALVLRLSLVTAVAHSPGTAPDRNPVTGVLNQDTAVVLNRDTEDHNSLVPRLPFQVRETCFGIPRVDLRSISRPIGGSSKLPRTKIFLSFHEMLCQKRRLRSIASR